MASSNDHSIPPGITSPGRRTITNVVLKDKVQFVQYGYENDGKSAEVLVWCQPGGGPPFHYHNSYQERFTAIEGDLIVYLDDDRLVLKPGESATVPIGHKHRFAAEGTEEIKFKGEIIPAHAGFERALYILYGLANEGLCLPDGIPKSPIHKAIALEMSDMSLPGVFGAVVNGAVKVLAAYGRWSGEEERLLKKYWDSTDESNTSKAWSDDSR